MMISLSKNEKGSTVLLMTAVVMAAILTVVLTSSEIIRNGVISDKIQLDATKAYFAAEAGAEKLLWDVRFNNLTCNVSDCVNFSSPDSCDSTCSASNLSENLANNSSYRVIYDDVSNSKVKSIGRYLSVNRVVEISY